jgi:hypothetical protein
MIQAMHIPLGIGLLIYLAIVGPGLYRKWKIERSARRTFAVGAGLTKR